MASLFAGTRHPAPPVGFFSNHPTRYPVFEVGDVEEPKGLLRTSALGVHAAREALAATGYGIMVGTLAGSHEQASMFGAVSIVIAAALGGIMIPAYVMPRYMQTISTFSPLAWGLTAFQDVFVRGGTICTIGPGASALSGFFVVTITVAWLSLHRQRSME